MNKEELDQTNLIPQLYRQEYSKMVSVICSRFGIDQMDAAEDIVSETFLSAAETWGLKGIPDNPVSWLYKVARNNALNGLKHDRVFRERVRGQLLQSSPGSAEPELDISPQNLMDSQLRMLFAVCDPAIPVEAQVSLALRVLCGFSIDEIAQALLTTKATINKRLYRAKEKLRTSKTGLVLPTGAALDSRLDAVLITLYLLFNEGYYSASPDKILRKDLCVEAMRLVYLLTEYSVGGGGRSDEGRSGEFRSGMGGSGVRLGAGEVGSGGAGGVQSGAGGRLDAGGIRSDVYSLLALMCFQASRLDARVDDAGGLVLYEQQDMGRWDQELINRGNSFFVRGCSEELLSRYHLEAAIAWWHTQQGNSREKWENVLMLYNRLLILEYSPVAALNRAYAFARVYGKEKAIPEAEGLGLTGNLFYHSLLGELYSGVDDGLAVCHFEKALKLVKTAAEGKVIREKLEGCRRGE